MIFGSGRCRIISFLMDHSFTAAIKAWLDTPLDERNITQGAQLLLQLTGNRIMYANILAAGAARMEFLEHQLQKHYDFRVMDLTHEQVRQMESQVDAIARSLSLESPAQSESNQTDNPADKDSRLLGRRPDHDRLPDEIVARYRENFSILQRMRELHLKLRMLTLTDHPCPDSERYPFLRDLIALDKKLHANWQVYDQFVLADSADDAGNPTDSQ